MVIVIVVTSAIERSSLEYVIIKILKGGQTRGKVGLILRRHVPGTTTTSTSAVLLVGTTAAVGGGGGRRRGSRPHHCASSTPASRTTRRRRSGAHLAAIGGGSGGCDRGRQSANGLFGSSFGRSTRDNKNQQLEEETTTGKCDPTFCLLPRKLLSYGQ